MTHSMTRLKLGTASLIALGLSACSTAPQNGVVATDLTGTFSQMWSGVFSGELRPAPQPSYSFGTPQNYGPQYALGAHDATLNTQRLMNTVTKQAAAQPNYYRPGTQPRYAKTQFPQSFMPQGRIQRRSLPAPGPSTDVADFTPPAATVSSNRFSAPPQQAPLWNSQPLGQEQDHIEARPNTIKPVKKRSFGSRLKSIFKPKNTSGYQAEKMQGFETLRQTASQAAPKLAVNALPPRPAQSQPVISKLDLPREAYPVPAPNRQPAVASASAIPPLASFKDIAPTGRAVDTQELQSSNQEIGDSLSYVKMGGGSKISDWQECEKQAGGYFVTTPTGFVLEPKFDSCMRSLGYKPESEAEAQLSAAASPQKTAPKYSASTPAEQQAFTTREIDTSAIPTSRRYPSRERRGS